MNKKRITVLYKPAQKELVGAAQKGIQLARRNFSRVEDLINEALTELEKLPMSMQLKGYIMIGRECEQHIASLDFSKNGHIWDMNKGISFTEFLQAHCMHLFPSEMDDKFVAAVAIATV